MKRLAVTGLLALSLVSAAGRQEPSPLRRAGDTVRSVLEGEEPDLAPFLDAWLAPSLVEKESKEVLLDALLELHDRLRGREPDEIYPAGEREVLFVYPRRTVLHVRLSAKDPARIADVWIEDGPGLDGDADHSAPPGVAPFTWASLAQRMREEERAGFAGALVVVRDGEVVLDEGYGLANREKEVRNRPDTIFAIGSTPIDFTKAGILLLREAGELTLDDPIAKYLDGVPEDKRSMTLGHCFHSRSGLQDFLGEPSDPDPDHFYIDRAEALRRILGQELLFEPGQAERHSHAAWGLLAAVIEIVADQTYEDFCRENLFEPAGMKDTGPFGVTLPEERTAVGYGSMSGGEVNAPPYWGPTSWLVKGSGGMVSTTADMLRWNRALRSGKLLSPESLTLYWAPPGALLAGGDMFGFEIVYSEGPGSLFVLTSNAVTPERRRHWELLARALFTLVRS